MGVEDAAADAALDQRTPLHIDLPGGRAWYGHRRDAGHRWCHRRRCLGGLARRLQRLQRHRFGGGLGVGHAWLGHGTGHFGGQGSFAIRRAVQAVPGATDEGPHMPGLGGVRCHVHLHRALVSQLCARRGQRNAGPQRHHQQITVGPGPAQRGVAQRAELRGQRVWRQFAHHQHAKAAEGQQHARHVRARRAIGADVGGVHAHWRAVGQRHFDELQHRQRHAMALAADRQALHTCARRAGQAGQQAQRCAGAHVVQGNEFGRVQREFLLQAHAHVAGDKELDLIVGDAAANVVAALAEVGVAVSHNLRARRQQIIPAAFAAGDAGGVRPGGIVATSVHRRPLIVCLAGMIGRMAPQVRGSDGALRRIIDTGRLRLRPADPPGPRRQQHP